MLLAKYHRPSCLYIFLRFHLWENMENIEAPGIIFAEPVFCGRSYLQWSEDVARDVRKFSGFSCANVTLSKFQKTSCQSQFSYLYLEVFIECVLNKTQTVPRWFVRLSFLLSSYEILSTSKSVRCCSRLWVTWIMRTFIFHRILKDFFYLFIVIAPHATDHRDHPVL